MRAVGFTMLLAAAAFGIAAGWIHTLPLSGELGSTGGVLLVTGSVVTKFASRGAGEEVKP